MEIMIVIIVLAAIVLLPFAGSSTTRKNKRLPMGYYAKIDDDWVIKIPKAIPVGKSLWVHARRKSGEVNEHRVEIFHLENGEAYGVITDDGKRDVHVAPEPILPKSAQKARRVIAIDTETTGLPKNGEQPGIVEVALVVYEDGRQVAKYAPRINPEREIEPGAIRTHGITSEMVKGAPKYADVHEHLQNLIASCDLAIMYNKQFDTEVINAAALKSGHVMRWPETLCLMEAVSRKRGGRWIKLENAYKEIVGKSLENAHSAEADAKACAECFFALQNA